MATLMLPRRQEMGATSNWNVSDAEFPVGGSGRDKLGFAAKYAVLAPTECSWQPWKFRFHNYFAELFAADGQTVESLDPEGRETMISCGAALYHLRLALRRFGCLGRTELFPDLARPGLVARVHAGVLGERDANERRLFKAMTSPINVVPWSGGEVADSLMPGLLSGAVSRGRGWLEVVRSEQCQSRLIGLTGALPPRPVGGVRVQNTVLARFPGGDGETNGPAGTTLLQRFSRWRRPMAGGRVNPVVEDKPNALEAAESTLPRPVFAVLKTKTDEKHGWLAAGQTLAWLKLQTRVLGLPCSLFNHVLQRPEIRSELRLCVGHKGFVQSIARLGTGQPSTANQPGWVWTATATRSSS